MRLSGNCRGWAATWENWTSFLEECRRLEITLRQIGRLSEAQEREEVKERIEKELVLRALYRDCRNEGESASGSDVEERKPRRKKSKRATPDIIADEMQSFGECLRDVDLARLERDRERLEIEAKRLELDRNDGEEERKLRREEFAANRSSSS
jgi:hypothetical protein